MKSLDENRISVMFTFKHPKIEGATRTLDYSVTEDEITLEQVGTKCEVHVDIGAVTKRREERGCAMDTKVEISVIYPTE